MLRNRNTLITGLLLGAVQTLAPGCATAEQLATAARAPRVMERLGRGVVAVRQDDGKIFVSWRVLGTDPDRLGFDLYRSEGNGQPVKLNPTPLTGPTHFVDSTAKLLEATSYFVRPVQGGRQQAASEPFVLPALAPARPYLGVPLQTPEGYTPNDASAADLDGDGEYEIVLHQTRNSRDNTHEGETGPAIFQAYKLDGTLLWTVNLGRNVREGPHYTQFMVYDLDSDGRAEFVCKTADGTTDSRGKVIGDPAANHVDKWGRILTGPEYLTVFDSTGVAVATTRYLPARHPDTDSPTSDQMKAIWGDGYGNRMDRFLACVAYLDGVNPSVVMARGYYTRTVLAAYDWRGGQLTNRWVFDSSTPGNEKYAGQGNHGLSVADVDSDGRDEIVYGKMVVDDNGQGLFSTGLGHGDALHVSDLVPARPGLEAFSIQESYRDAGLHMFDARTGEILWKIPPGKAGSDKEGPSRGLSMDVDPRHPGFESWGAGAGMWGQMFDAQGRPIDTGGKSPPVNFGLYWDGDLLRETLDGTRIGKWDYEGRKHDILLDSKELGCASNNGTKATPVLSADLLGDWREEVIWRSEDNKELRIFTTTIPTEHRLPTLMHDAQYRLAIAWQNIGYNQPPHPSFYIGPGMQKPPRPNITFAGPAPEAAAKQ